MPDLIITENYLKSVSLISGNTDMKMITPIIQLVQDKYIKPILGTKLYNEIQSQVNTPPVSSTNQALLDDYVIPCMVWYIMSESTPALKYRYMNKGVMVSNSENSNPADLQEILFLMERWRINAEGYAESVTKFLKRYRSTYPLYDDNNEIDEIKPNKTNYTSGFALDDYED